MAIDSNKRRSKRFPFESLKTEVEFGGRTIPVRVADLSQNGVRIAMDEEVDLEQDQEINIAVGKISPNIRARVCWSKNREGGGREVGLEFNSFLLIPPATDESASLVSAWNDLTQSYTLMESFIHILHRLDTDILDGRITELSDVLYNITHWLDQQVGPLNVWVVMAEGGGLARSQMLYMQHDGKGYSLDQRNHFVDRGTPDEAVRWMGEIAFIRGGNIVVEYLGGNNNYVDLLQKLVIFLSQRMHIWSQMLIQSIAIGLLGEELEHLRNQ